MKPSVAAWALLLAAGAVPPALAMPFDHLDCQRIRDPEARQRARATLVPADPAFATREGCTLMLPARYLCTASEAADVRPEPPGAAPGPEAHAYLCYRARCGGERQQVSVRDRFGERVVALKGTRLVCAPRELPDASTTTTTTFTTTSTTMQATTSTVVPTTSTSSSSTSTSSSSTTSTAPPTTSTSSSTTSTIATTSTTSTQPTVTTTTSSTSTTTTTLAGPEPPSPGCPVVNEVMTGGTSSASEELVEILNPCGHALALEGARVLYQSATGGTQRTLVTWEVGAVLAAGGRLLYVTSQLGGPADGEFASGLSGTGGGVAVADATDVLIDGVGWGTATNAFVEGSAAPAPPAGAVIARIPDGADSDDNASDWQQVSPTPGQPND